MQSSATRAAHAGVGCQITATPDLQSASPKARALKDALRGPIPREAWNALGPNARMGRVNNLRQ